LRILAVEPYSGTPGHFDWFAIRTCEGWSRRGHEVTLATYSGISFVNLPVITPFRVVDAGGRSARDSDARLVDGKIDLRSWRSFVKRQSQELKTFYHAFSLMREEAFDVVYFLDADPVSLLVALRTMVKRRDAERIAILAHLHETSRLEPTKRSRARAWRALSRYALSRLIKKDLDALIVCDDFLKSQLIDRLRLSGPAGNKVHVLPHGMDEPQDRGDKEGARRRLNLSPDETIFLLFGGLRKNKRIDLALEAIRGLRSCRLLIAGIPQDYNAAGVQELIRTRRCEEFVSTEVRYIDEGRMHDYFLASDAVILPYAADFKGQSGILTRACSHGKSVIASDVGALGRTVREAGNGLVVEPESADRLRAAMNEFLSLKPEDRMQMEAKSRFLATRQSWISVCSQVEDICSRILNRKKGRAIAGQTAAH
jgi:glycosyltransferase involved in cell wall biosynthesis